MKFLAFLILFSLSTYAQEEEESEALRAMRISCEKQRVALGCFNYANMLIRNDNAEAADKYYELGCKLQHTPSCSKDKWDLPPLASSAKTSPEAEPESAPEAPAVAPAEASEPEPGETDLSLDPGETINE
ncbi:MAG: hypothetical protein H0V66_08820 [Bdellovibrionales bacterium]|nr:hypothetical protein [Bdellovibrionales bacterium]